MLPPGSSTSLLVALTQFQLADVSQTADLLQPVPVLYIQGSGIGPCLFIVYTMDLKPGLPRWRCW